MLGLGEGRSSRLVSCGSAPKRGVPRAMRGRVVHTVTAKTVPSFPPRHLPRKSARISAATTTRPTSVCSGALWCWWRKPINYLRTQRRCEVKRCLSVIDRPTLDSGPPRFRLGPADRPTAARSASRKALGSDRPTDRPSRAARAQRGRVGTGRPTDRRQFDSVIYTRHSLL